MNKINLIAEESFIKTDVSNEVKDKPLPKPQEPPKEDFLEEIPLPEDVVEVKTNLKNLEIEEQDGNITDISLKLPDKRILRYYTQFDILKPHMFTTHSGYEGGDERQMTKDEFEILDMALMKKIIENPQDNLKFWKIRDSIVKDMWGAGLERPMLLYPYPYNRLDNPDVLPLGIEFEYSDGKFPLKKMQYNKYRSNSFVRQRWVFESGRGHRFAGASPSSRRYPDKWEARVCDIPCLDKEEITNFIKKVEEQIEKINSEDPSYQHYLETLKSMKEDYEKQKDLFVEDPE